jgi:amino acid adenylation domain-containing protein
MMSFDLPSLSIEPLEVERAQRRALQRSEPFDLTEPVGAYIQRQAAFAPDTVAVVDGRQSITYARLAERVAAAARVIAAVAPNPGAVVAVSGRRGAYSIIAFLAIEHIDGVYLPIEEHWPASRVEDILRRSGAACILVEDASSVSASLVAAAAALNCPLVALADAASAEKRPDDATPARRAFDPESPRYVLYTSGSTGSPKGAIVEHRGMLNHLLAKVLELEIRDTDCIAQTAPLTFDISIWQMLAGLLVGARVCVLGDEEALSPTRLIEAVAANSITILEVVPTILSFILDELEAGASSALNALKYLLATGEALPPSTARRWIQANPTVPLVNAYGPTECSDDVTHEIVTLPLVDPAIVPIGRPIPNARLYRLVEENGSFRAAVDDEPGELFVGGICVGRGYLGDPDRTRDAFFNDPFERDGRARLYRTGDLVRVAPSGSLLYLGRIDRQVKVAGVRIELGEIEEAIRSHENVTDAAVVLVEVPQASDPSVAQESSGGLPRLVAFVTGAKVHSTALRSYLSQRLLRSMVPSDIIVIAEMPLTANKKVDFRKLEAMARRSLASDASFSGAAMFSHRALVHATCAGDRTPPGPSSFALFVESSHDALQSVAGLAMGVTQYLSWPDVSSPESAVSGRRGGDAGAAVSISKACLRNLSGDEARSLREKITHVVASYDSAAESRAFVDANFDEAASPPISVHVDAEAALGVASYRLPSDRAVSTT